MNDAALTFGFEFAQRVHVFAEYLGSALHDEQIEVILQGRIALAGDVVALEGGNQERKLLHMARIDIGLIKHDASSQRIKLEI